MKNKEPPRPHPDDKTAVILWLTARVTALAKEFDTGPAGLERLIEFAKKMQQQNIIT